MLPALLGPFSRDKASTWYNWAIIATNATHIAGLGARCPSSTSRKMPSATARRCLPCDFFSIFVASL